MKDRTGAMDSSARLPKPPGMMRTSMSGGAVSNVCVGTMDWAKLEAGGSLGVKVDR